MTRRPQWGRWWKCVLLPLAAGVAAVLGCHYDEYTVSTAPAVYSIHELGLLPGGTQSQANAGSGTVIAGWAIVSGSTRHAVTFSGGQAHALAEPGGATSSEARGVNANGAIVGFATIGGVRQGVVWSSSSAASTLLPSLGGAYSFARSINDEGIIVGQAQVDTITDTGDTVIVMWTPGAGGYTVERLDPSEGGDFSPTAINALGQIVGNAPPAAPEPGGFIWESDSTGFETVEPPGSNGDTDANGFNNYGVIVGGFENPTGQTRGFLFTAALGSFEITGPPSGFTEVEANAVNDSGRVAATASNVDNLGAATSSIPLIGTMLDSVHTLTKLPTLNGGFAQPVDNAITDCGVVLGWASKTSANTPRYAVAWVPQGCTLP